MPIISDGTVNVTSGFKTITFTGGKLLDKGVKAGNWFKLAGEEKRYHFELTPTDNINGQLVETYGGVTQANVAYQIFTDYSALGRAILTSTVKDGYTVVEQDFQVIEDVLAAAGITGAGAEQCLNKKYVGVPVQNNFFGYQKFTGGIEITKLVLSSQDGEATDNNLILDVEINGALQGLNLTVPAGSSSVTSAVLSYIVQAGQVIRLKWITVTEPCSSNWDVDVHYHNSSGLRIYYDFQKMYFGDIYENLVIGAAYKPPNRGKVFGLTYDFDEAPVGSDVVLELLKNGASLVAPVTCTIPANSSTGYLELSQTEFLTTDICSLRVTQPGSVIPGSNLRTVLHSYHTTA